MLRDGEPPSFFGRAATQPESDRFRLRREKILAAFRGEGFELVRKACEDAKHLERITGLDKLEEETERLLAEGVDWEDGGNGSDEDDF